MDLLGDIFRYEKILSLDMNDKMFGLLGLLESRVIKSGVRRVSAYYGNTDRSV